MKIAKIVFLLLTLGWGANALAGTQLICSTITNPKTGDKQKICAYVDVGQEKTVRWSFTHYLMSLHNQLEGETVNYDYVYDSLSTVQVSGCADAKRVAANDNLILAPEYTCLTLEETFLAMREDISEDFAQWFMTGGGCEGAVDVASMVGGIGVMRLVARKTSKKLVDDIWNASTEQQRRELKRKYDLRGDMMAAFGVAAGYVIGESLNEKICDALFHQARYQGARN